MYNPVTVRSADGRPFAKENSFALLTGVGRRAADSEHMQVTATDADMLRRALVGAFQLFDEKKVTTLINGEATVANITGQLDALIESTKVTKADFIIIYFSGHGYEREGNYFLIANDTAAWKAEDNDIEITEVAKKINAIEATLFAEKLTAIDCNKMLVLLDCCHSGGVTEKPLAETVFKDCPNRVVLTACARGQVSYLSKPVSIFTYALIEALGGKFLTGTETTVSVFSLAMAVRERVAALSQLVLQPAAEPQKPVLDVLENSQTFNYPIARYLKGGPQEIRLLKEEIKSISTEDGAKKIDTDSIALPGRDDAYRQSFLWLENSIVQSVMVNGNSNIVQATNQAIQQTGNNNQAINIATGASAYFGTDYDEKKRGFMDSILIKLETWKNCFDEEDEKNLEKEINDLNNKIDGLAAR